MSERWAGFVISGETITVVEATIPDDDDRPIEVLSDATWKVQRGGSAQAYDVLYGRCVNFLRDGDIEHAVIKASATTRGAATLSLLHSAEVRGVVIAAAATAAAVSIVQKSVVSRTYGDQNVDDYLSDDAFWKRETIGIPLRKTSREAVMYIIATRAKMK